VRIETTAERIVHGGRALARLEDGRVALIAGALPGERVVADVAPRAGVLQGAVAEVLEPSPDRVPAPEHPGLDLGFVRYDAQLRLKADVVQDAASRARLTLPEGRPAVVAAPATWAYRSAVQPAVRGGRLGYRREGSRQVVLLDEDPTAMPSVAAAWRRLVRSGLPGSVQEVAIRGNDRGEALVALVATAPAADLLDLAHGLVGEAIAGVALAPHDPRSRFRSGKERLAGARFLLQRYGDVELSVSATAFAQPNPAAAGLAFGDLASLAPGGRRAVDLFAGGGAIAFHLAPRYDEVVAVEVASESVARGRSDARRLGRETVRFERVDAKRFELPEADTIVVDPPRAGLASELRQRIDASEASSLLYLSCDVATWARDAADFVARGWRLRTVRPYDFQPHTHHLEVLSAFER
jgi:tRNA/tmRNA/rRNA uracil-C5-methylase (TrmA/RlmC/RlmD family)